MLYCAVCTSVLPCVVYMYVVLCFKLSCLVLVYRCVVLCVQVCYAVCYAVCVVLYVRVCWCVAATAGVF